MRELKYISADIVRQIDFCGSGCGGDFQDTYGFHGKNRGYCSETYNCTFLLSILRIISLISESFLSSCITTF